MDGDRAAVPWRGSTQLKHGGGEELSGVSLLRFDAEGLVIEQARRLGDGLTRVPGNGR